MNLWHKQLEGRFPAFPEHQQILMVCTELNRARNNRSDPGEYKNCMERSLELIDFLIGDPKWSKKLKEVLRARGLVAEAYLKPPRDTLSLQRTLIQLSPAAWRLMNGDTAL